MKLFRFKSITFRISFLYLMLAVINMSIFTIMIYENQIDLISENTRYHVTELADSLISSIDNYTDRIQRSRHTGGAESTIEYLRQIIKKSSKDFVIFAEDGSIDYKTNESIKISQNDILNGIRAVTNKDFTGTRFFSKIDHNTYSISFYIPLNISNTGTRIILIKYSMSGIGDRLNNLYRLIIIVISMLALLHIFTGIIFYRMFLRPVKTLHRTSLEITSGNLDARSDIKQDDEIGQLAKAFNSMADSIKEKITTLQRQNDQIDFELKIAGEIQKVIFPHLASNNHFNFSIFHRAYGQVSGDYHDIFEIDRDTHGALIVDVSGHGVPAALITMIAKEIFKRTAPLYSDPAELLKHVNTEVSEILRVHDTEPGVYFTAFYGILDHANQLHFCNAGHPDPFLIRKGSGKIETLSSSGFLIGVSSDMNHMYKTEKTTISTGDKVVLFTDGVTEAKNNENVEYGISRLLEILQKNIESNPETIQNEIINDLSSFTDIESLKDDATVFIIEIKQEEK